MNIHLIFYILFIQCKYSYSFTTFRGRYNMNMNNDIYKNTLGPLTKYNINNPIKDVLYESHRQFLRTSNIVEENVHNVGNDIHKVGFDLYITGEKINHFANEIHNVNNDLSNILHNKEDFINYIGHEMGYSVVKVISALLPHVDSIAHKVLHMDDVLINQILNLSLISPELKKNIILFIVHISQEGDNIGGYMLQLYYDIINKLM